MSAPIIYHYDRITHELLGIGLADPDPLQPGMWLYPADSTTVAPPAVPAGKRAVLDGDGWSLVADHRGETWWKDGQSFTINGLGDPASEGFSPEGPPATGEYETAIWENGAWAVKIDRRGETWWSDHNTPVTIDFLGDPADQGLFPERPEPEPEPEPTPAPEPEPPTLADAIATKLAELDDYRWQVEVGGAVFAGMVIRTDWNSQAKITAAYTMAKLDPGYSIPTWEVVPGVFMPLDNATIVAMGEAVRDHVQDTFNRKAVLHQAIQALEAVNAVVDYDIASEWAAVA